MEHVIDFRPNGTIEAMHSDAFSLGFLGSQRIRRASEIRWNEEAQCWGIWLAGEDATDFIPPPAVLDGFAKYDTARRFEVKLLNQCRTAQVDPTSPEGERIAASLR